MSRKKCEEKLNQCFIGARIESLQLFIELKQFVTGRGVLLYCCDVIDSPEMGHIDKSWVSVSLE